MAKVICIFLRVKIPFTMEWSNLYYKYNVKRAYYAKLGHQLCTTLLFEQQNAPSASNIYPLLHIKSHKCVPYGYIYVLRTKKYPKREV